MFWKMISPQECNFQIDRLAYDKLSEVVCDRLSKMIHFVAITEGVLAEVL